VALDIVEEALGDDADRVLPHALRIAELRVRLLRHHIAMLEYRAWQDQTTISGVLAKELDGTRANSTRPPVRRMRERTGDHTSVPAAASPSATHDQPRVRAILRELD
jgi:hypothetical protein